MEFPIRLRDEHAGIIEDAGFNKVAEARTPENARAFVNACALLESLGYRCGYDGSWFKAGDRVELHPGTDLWMRGARYGIVTRISLTRQDAVRVTLDARPNGGPFGGPADRFRKVQS
jgi:hypothetical protein